MIFLTVGTQSFQFNRLLEAVDNLIDEKIIQETVIAQIGESTYVPRNYLAYPFLDSSEFSRLMGECDLLITHSGVGTILEGLSANKRIIVVPRRKDYREHVDDHQEEIADKFGEQGSICVCKDVNKLGECYQHVRSSTPQTMEIRLNYSNTANFVNGYLESLNQSRKKVTAWR